AWPLRQPTATAPAQRPSHGTSSLASPALLLVVIRHALPAHPSRSDGGCLTPDPSPCRPTPSTCNECLAPPSPQPPRSRKPQSPPASRLPASVCGLSWPPRRTRATPWSVP